MQNVGDALKLSISNFIDLYLPQDGLLDQLHELECLTEYEYNQIRAKPTSTDQVRLLIVRIKDSCPEIVDKFLKALKGNTNYNPLYTKVMRDLKEIEQKKSTAICVICYMMNSVYIPEIADFLWKENLISSPLYSDIVAQAPEVKSRQLVWDHIFDTLGKLKNRQLSIELLKEALGAKYSHIAEYLDHLPEHSPFSCCCCKRRPLRPRKDFIRDSQSEYSTTSTA